MALSTKERIMRLETKLDNIHDKLDTFIEAADKKYATKLTETIVYGLVALILMAFVAKILNAW